MADSLPVDMARRSHSGLNRWGRGVDEEWLKELRGRKGIKVYREMSDNEPIIGALLFATRTLIRGTEWSMVDPVDEGAELDERAEFIEECRGDMEVSWDNVIDEALSMFEYGWSAQEILFKVRRGRQNDVRLNSKYTDGRVGWRNLTLIGQETLDEWQWDSDGDLLEGLHQQVDYNFRSNVFSGMRPFIPRYKFTLNRTSQRKANPEGRSLLRNAYRPWYFKKQIEIFEAIGIERDAAGIPVLGVPADIMLPNPPEQLAAIRADMELLVEELKRDEREGIVLPNEEAGYKLTLLQGAGPRQIDIDPVIKRKAVEILQSVLADFISVGHEEVGSFALNISKIGLFTTAINAFLESLEEVFQRELVIPTLIINGFDPVDAPVLKAGKVQIRDVATKIEGVVKLSQGHLMPFDPQPAVTNSLLRDLGLPEIDEEEFVRPEPVVGPEGVPGGGF